MKPDERVWRGCSLFGACAGRWMRRRQVGPTAPSPATVVSDGHVDRNAARSNATGEPDRRQAQVTWTFEAVAGTNLQTFSVTIRSQNAWLPITTTVTSAITPSNQPPARISTQGNYPSPRGCTGTLLSVGNAETHTHRRRLLGRRLLALTNSTFTGHVTLTKTG